MDTFHSLVHVCHKEWIMEIFKARTEERTCLVECMDTPLDEEFRQNRVHSKFR